MQADESMRGIFSVNRPNTRILAGGNEGFTQQGTDSSSHYLNISQSRPPGSSTLLSGSSMRYEVGGQKNSHSGERGDDQSDTDLTVLNMDEGITNSAQQQLQFDPKHINPYSNITSAEESPTSPKMAWEMRNSLEQSFEASFDMSNSGSCMANPQSPPTEAHKKHTLGSSGPKNADLQKALEKKHLNGKQQSWTGWDGAARTSTKTHEDDSTVPPSTESSSRRQSSNMTTPSKCPSETSSLGRGEISNLMRESAENGVVVSQSHDELPSRPVSRGGARPRRGRRNDDSKDDEFIMFCGEYAKFSPALVHRYHHKFWQKTKRVKARNQVERFYSTLFFADISGFTRLSARLTAEQLKFHVNTYFTRMIDVVKRYGGDIVKFCGDAVMILWPCERNASAEVKQANAYLAGLCALAMLKECGEYDVGKGKTAVSLRLHCGMGASNLFGYYVGHEERWEYLIAGDALRQIGESESEATHGQTIVSPESWELLKNSFTAEKTPKGNWLLLDVQKADAPVQPASFMRSVKLNQVNTDENDARPGTAGGSAISEEEEQARSQARGYLGDLLDSQYSGTCEVRLAKLSKALRAYVHESARHAIEAKADDYIAELRRVTTIFININGIESHLENGSLKTVQNIMQFGQEHLTQYKGTMRQFIVDDKGCVMIGAFGLPHYSHEDNESRAIQASQGLMAALNEMNVSCQIGIAAGSVYCGYVGTNKRCEYAMMGCSVNLAARLMASAPDNSMQVDQEVFLGSENLFSFEKLKPINAKGYEKPVQVYRPGQQVLVKRGMSFRQGQTHTGTEKVIGFEDEVTQIKNALQELKIGRRPNSIILIGPAGSGKSHILQSTDLTEILEECKAETLIGFAKNVHESTPFYVWRRILHQFFGLDDDEDNEGSSDDPTVIMQKATKVERWLTKYTNQTVQELAPLLNDICDFGLEENSVTKKLDYSERSENREHLIVELLKLKSSLKPLVFVVENAQWMDAPSWALCHAVMTSDIRFLVIMALRPLTEYFEEVPPEFTELQKTADTIELPPLSEQQCYQLALTTVGNNTLRDYPEMFPPDSAEILSEKTAGNPLFVKNLALAFKDAFIQGKHKKLNDMPSGVFKDLIISRFDMLDQREQLVLKAASILGTTKFSVPILRYMLPEIGEDEGQADKSTQDALDALVSSNFLSKEGEDDCLYAFVQSSVQETIYDLMLLDQRQKWHGTCAKWYEENLLGEAGNIMGRQVVSAAQIMLITHHWLNSNVTQKKIEYLQKEAMGAEEGFRNEDTVQAYNQLLNLAFNMENQTAMLLCVKSKEKNTEGLPVAGTPQPTRKPGRLSLSLSDIKQSLMRRPRKQTPPRRQAERRGSLNAFDRSHSLMNPVAKKLGYNFLDREGLKIYNEYDHHVFSSQQIGLWIGKMSLAFYQKGRLASSNNHAQTSLLYMGFRAVPLNSRAQGKLIARNRLSMLRSLGSKRQAPTDAALLALQLYEHLILIQYYRSQVKAIVSTQALVDYMVDSFDFSTSASHVARLNGVYGISSLAQGNLNKTKEYIRRGESAAAHCAKAHSGTQKPKPSRSSITAASLKQMMDSKQVQRGLSAASLFYLARALMNVGLGEWDKSITDCKKILDMYSKMGDMHRYGEVLCLQSYILLAQGYSSQALAHFADIRENSNRTNNFFLRLTSTQAQALIYALMGEDAKAIKAIMDVQSIPGVGKKNLVSNSIQAYIAVRKGSINEALRYFDFCVSRYCSRTQIMFTAVFNLHILCEALLALLESNQEEFKEHYPRLLQYLQSLLKTFQKLAVNAQPVFSPLYELSKARHLRLLNKESSAQNLLEKISAQAEQSQFLYAAAHIEPHLTRRESEGLQNVGKLSEIGLQLLQPPAQDGLDNNGGLTTQKSTRI